MVFDMLVVTIYGNFGAGFGNGLTPRAEFSCWLTLLLLVLAFRLANHHRRRITSVVTRAFLLLETRGILKAHGFISKGEVQCMRS
jgi:hypothetical protein